MKKFFCVLAIGLVSFNAFADEDPIEGSVALDYNIGGGVQVNHDQHGNVSNTDVNGGAMVNGELVVTGPLGDKHFMIIDARALAFIGGGAQVAGDGAPKGLFSLRLIGSIAGGLMAYKVLPANIALEDLDLRVRNDKVSGSLLLGSTIYLPINLLTRMDMQNLYLAVTPGLRYNSDGGEAAFAFQTKLRYAAEKYSLEARYLMTLGSNTNEKKGVIQAGINNIFMNKDQLGIYLSKGVVTGGDGNVVDITEGMLFYGGSF